MNAWSKVKVKKKKKRLVGMLTDKLISSVMPIGGDPFPSKTSPTFAKITKTRK